MFENPVIPRARRAHGAHGAHRVPRGRAGGFTLIEILVSLTLVAIGLLGLAQLIVKGQRASFEAYQRQQAITLANDMLEKIRANRARAADYVAAAPVATPLGAGTRFNDLVTGAITNCAVATCTPDVLAAYDAAYWDGLLQGTTEFFAADSARTGGATNARGCIEIVVAAVGPSTQATYRVTVAWQGRDETVAPVTSTCGNGLYGTETRRRVVSLDVRV
ncbi:MAG: type IV pilus modification protein PilV [bacterium]|jgi:type IV pilus assembly protein PilV|nr:type IV pilus modification protein PilV [Betaproteobacteria bacterium]